jgi:hypothetical protein
VDKSAPTLVLQACVICPTGCPAIFLSSLPSKNFSLSPSGKSPLPTRPVPPHRGAARDRHERGAGCDGRGGAARRAAPMRTAKSCGPDAPTLASSRRRCFRISLATVARKPGHRGERDISRKTIARGMPGVFGVTVVTNARVFYHHARLRAHRAPGIPCALISEGGNSTANLARRRGERAEPCLRALLIEY